jgi:hypothetical protein
MVVPAATGTRGAGIAIGVADVAARLAAVPLKMVVPPEVITTANLAHRSVAEPLAEPLFVWVQFDPAFNVNVAALTVPTFLMVMGVTTAVPGTMAWLPPNLLMVLHVEVLVDMLPPSVLRQVTVPELFCSCMIRAPVPAVFWLLVMLATNPERVPVSDSERIRAAAAPVASAIGVNLRRLACELVDIELCLSGIWCGNRAMDWGRASAAGPVMARDLFRSQRDRVDGSEPKLSGVQIIARGERPPVIECLVSHSPVAEELFCGSG